MFSQATVQLDVTQSFAWTVLLLWCLPEDKITHFKTVTTDSFYSYVILLRILIAHKSTGQTAKYFARCNL
jgi:hypothetical protein